MLNLVQNHDGNEEEASMEKCMALMSRGAIKPLADNPYIYFEGLCFEAVEHEGRTGLKYCGYLVH